MIEQIGDFQTDAQPTGALQTCKNAAFTAQQAACGSELAGFLIDRQFSRAALLPSAVAADVRRVDAVLARILL
jgi:hypothetical protein